MYYIQQQRYDIVANNLRKWENKLTEKEMLLYKGGLLKYWEYSPEMAEKIKEISIEYFYLLLKTIPKGEVTAKDLRKLTP